MRRYHSLLVYDVEDERLLSSYEQDLARELRVATRNEFSDLCKDFGIQEFPQINVYLMVGDTIGNSVIIQNAGIASTVNQDDGRLSYAAIYYSLPFTLAMTEWQFDDTVPHEVAHVFTNMIYGYNCNHDFHWKEVMQYMKLNPQETFQLSDQEKNRVIDHLKFNTVMEAYSWAK